MIRPAKKSYLPILSSKIECPVTLQHQPLKETDHDHRKLTERLNYLQLFLMLVTVAAFLAYNPILFTSQTMFASQGMEREIIRPDAIVTVAMCGFKGTEMGKALREIGQWRDRPIYVITNTPELEDSSIVTPIDVRGNHPKFDSKQEWEDYKKHFNVLNPFLWTKWHKSQLFRLIPDSIQTLLYMDADILTSNNLEPFWNDLQRSMLDPKCQVVLYRERWNPRAPWGGNTQPPTKLVGYWNSGMMLLKRSQSEAILDLWGSKFVHEPFVLRDQGKLTDAFDELGSGVCRLPNRLKHMRIAADLVDKVWFKYVHTHTNVTFLHLASAKKGEWRDASSAKCTNETLVEQ